MSATDRTSDPGVLALLATAPAYAPTLAALRAAPRRWLVTGAAGFIGSHLVESLLGCGQEVVGLDDLSTGSHANLEDVRRRVGAAAARFRFVEGDVRNPADVAAALEGVDVVLHEAALVSVPLSIDEPERAHAINATGFLNVIDGARRAGATRFVYAASSASYGDDDAPVKTEEQVGRPLSMYAATKTANEAYAAAYAAAYGLRTVGLRYFNVFGPRQDPRGAYAAVIPAWVDALARRTPCVVHGDGGQTRDFCHVANVVGANLLAATTDAPAAFGRAFNVGTGAATDLLELFDAVRDALADALPDRTDLRHAAPVHGPPRAGDVRHSRADVGLAERVLGYRAVVGVREGIARTLPWYVAAAERTVR